MLHRKIRTTSSGRSFVRYLSGQDRSWNPGSPALQFENDDVMTVDRMAKRDQVARSLVGSDVHGGKGPRLERWGQRPLFRRGGLDRKFETAEEAVKLLTYEGIRRDPFQKNFALQLANFARSITPLIQQSPKNAWVVKHLIEPERTITFKVPWTDDEGHPRINRGFRVQYSSLVGPFFGGVRFAANANLSTFRSLAFETTLQNALTGLPIGGARGGADFSPVGKSESEIRNFCQSFIREGLTIFGLGAAGPHNDIPLGDLGVGEREMGYMFGAGKDLTKHGDIAMGGRAALRGRFHAQPFGHSGHDGSALTREHATGLGVVAVARKALSDIGDSLHGKRCLISGSGNVALAVAEALIEAGAIPISLSDTSGYTVEPDGFNAERLALVRVVKLENPYGYHRRISEYARRSPTAKFYSGKDSGGDLEREDAKKAKADLSAMLGQNRKLERTLTRGPDIGDSNDEPAVNEGGTGLWDVPCDLAFPCAAEMELTEGKVRALLENGCRGVFEGSDMATTPAAAELLAQHARESEGDIVHVPGKIANAGGTLYTAMQLLAPGPDMNMQQVEAASLGMLDAAKVAAMEFAPHDLNAGANIAALKRLASAMVDQGAV